MISRTRAKGGVQAQQLPSNGHMDEQLYDLITVKSAETTPNPGNVPFSPNLHAMKKNQEFAQTLKDPMKLVDVGNMGQEVAAKPGCENNGSKLNNGEIPLTISFLSNSQDIQGMSGTAPAPIFTNGGRPRRQAAIAGAARIKEVHQELLDESDEAREGFSQPANEKEPEGTIVCRETADLGTAKAKVVRKEVAVPAPKVDNGSHEQLVSPDGINEIEEIEEIEELDDENDEDFEIDKDETEDEDDGMMDGDENISEIEEMGGKEKNKSNTRKKGPSRNRKTEKDSTHTPPKKRIQSTHGVVRFRVTKPSQQDGIAKEFHWSGITHPHTYHAGEGDVNFTQELIQSILPPQFRENPPAPLQSIVNQQSLPDTQVLPVSIRDEIQNTQVMPLHTNENERAAYLPEWELSGTVPPSEYPAYPGLIQIGSEDDEPLFSGSTKRRTATQLLDPKQKKPRSAQRRPRAKSNSVAGVLGGPSETKFRRKEIADMLQVITKDIKWKDVQKAVGNERRTPGSYASHWKNVLMKNILERYQE